MAFVLGAPVRITTKSRAKHITARRQMVTSSAPCSPKSSTSTASTTSTTRRSILLAGVAAVGASLLPFPDSAFAEDLQQYKDLQKGFAVMRPGGWNEFEAAEGQYDIKWQDVIQPLEFVTVLTTPISKDKTLSDIGPVDKVGEKVANSRGGKLVAAVEKKIDDVPAYVLEIKKESAHQLTLLAVAKSKLYSLNVSASENRWPRREKLLRSVVDSFKPKL